MEHGHARLLLRRLDEERRRLAPGDQVIDRLPLLTRLRSADGSHHSVISSTLSDENADGAIAGEIEHHDCKGVGFEWKLYAHDAPPDLAGRLARHGFVIGPREAVLVRDSADLPADWRAGADGPAVARVDRDEQVREFRRVAEEVFGKDYTFTADELARGLAAGSTRHLGYIACAGDKSVGVGRLYTHPDSAFGGLYGGGTLPAYRGRGFYRAMVAARARDAAALGARYLIVDALPSSRPILERLGFARLTDTWPCEWRPAGAR